jgi:uncharacterized protein YbjT (DUF2867 family)
MMTTVFVTGGTGYIGRRLIERLHWRGHRVIALARAASVKRLPAGCEPVAGDALDADTFAGSVPKGCTYVQLVGTPHPSPAKAAEFRRVDLVSARESVNAARAAGVAHFIYVSVAQPAPVMQAYVAVRAEAESIIAEGGLSATILRPWYVLGPGHRWPYTLLPVYALARLVPRLREGAARLHPVIMGQMLASLVRVVETPVPNGIRVLDVPAIRLGKTTLPVPIPVPPSLPVNVPVPPPVPDRFRDPWAG